jgi:hypothetical protein
MVEKKLVMQSISIVSDPKFHATIKFATEEDDPTVVTVETYKRKGALRIIGYEEIYLSIEDANVLRCSCISTREDLYDPNCPEHGD